MDSRLTVGLTDLTPELALHLPIVTSTRIALLSNAGMNPSTLILCRLAMLREEKKKLLLDKEWYANKCVICQWNCQAKGSAAF